MSYTPTAWKNGPSGHTRVNATNLNNMESGIVANEAAAEAASEAAGSAEQIAGQASATASAATAAAEEARSAAATAASTASQAASDAAEAKSTASAATTLAGEAKSTATAATRAAEEAKTAADSAASIAEAAEAASEKNTADIEALKRKPSGITLTSASPLESSAAAGIVGLSARGKSEQYISKNLLPTKGLTTQKANGITFTPYYNSLGLLEYIDLDGKSTNRANVNTENYVSLPKGEYIFSQGTSEVSCFLRIETANKEVVGYVDLNGKAMQGFNVTDETYRYYFSMDVRKADITLSHVKVYPMIRKSTESADYEPYTGTPTPTNPIPIVDASGVIEAHTKNLLDKSNVTVASNTSKGFNVNLSSGTYTFSCNDNESKRVRVLFTDDAYVDVLNWKTDKTVTFTVDKSFKAVYINKGTAVDFDAMDCMLEQGTTASEYVAYASNEINLSSIGIDLRSVGNVKDELIVNPDGSGEWVQNAKKSVVDGSFDIYVSSWANQTNTVCVYWTNDGINPDYQGIYAMADKLPAVSRNYGANTDAEMVCMSGASAPYSTAIRILKSRIDGWSDGDTQAVKASKVKAWLVNNPITIYYPLATPIVHQLTAEQVAAILALQTYAGTTIVESELDDVVVDYITNTKDYVDQRTNIESIVEKELRTYNWEYGMAIDTRSGSIQTVIPRGFAFGENLQYKGLMIGEDGREKALKSLQVSFNIFESKMNVSWELPTNPYEGEGVTLKIIFYWETTSARAMPVVAMLNIDEEGEE